MPLIPFSVSNSEIQYNVVWGDVPFLEIDNLIIKKHGMVIKSIEYANTISEPAFLVDIREPWYHFWFDCIGQFLVLRQQVENLKLYFIDTYDQEDEPAEHVRLASKWLQKDDLGGSVIRIVNYQQTIFEKAYAISTKSGHRQEPGDAGDNKMHAEMLYGFCTDTKPMSVAEYIIPELRNFMRSHLNRTNRLPKDFEYPEKVYLYPSGTVRDIAAKVENYPALRENLMDDHAGRFLTSDELDRLDEFFLQIGYKVFDVQETHSWVDVTNIIMHAKSVVCYAGASTLNAMLADDLAQIIYLCPSSLYEFPHPQTLHLRHKLIDGSPQPIIIFDRHDLRLVFPYQKEFNFEYFGFDAMMSELEKVEL